MWSPNFRTVVRPWNFGIEKKSGIPEFGILEFEFLSTVYSVKLLYVTVQLAVAARGL
jgi:hypothetical protein